MKVFLSFWPVYLVFAAIVGLGCWLMIKIVRRGNALLADRPKKRLQALHQSQTVNQSQTVHQSLPPAEVSRSLSAHHDGPPAHRGEPFGYKTGWIAIRSDDAARILEVLGLTSPTRLGWTAGVNTAYERGVFATPAVDGWTLVMGAELSDGSSSAQLISTRLGCQVQVFASHRVSESHLWERASDNEGYRFFSIEDGDVESEGPLTDIERDLGIDDFVASWTSDDDEFDGEGIEIPDEDTVMAVAANWSLDPNQLGDPDDQLGWYSPTGIRPELSR